MSFKFENAAVDEVKEAAAMEAFVSFAKLKKEDAFSKVEESFAKRMKAADVKMLKLIVSIPAPKTYEYSVTPAKLDKDDFKFVWQLLKGTNSYKEGLPKWNICTITVNSGKIADVKFQLSPVLLKKFQAKMPKAEKGTETLDLVEDLIELQSAYEGLDASVKELDAVEKLMDNVRIATEAAKIGDYNVALQMVGAAQENFVAANVDVAMEGFSDAAKDAWEKFKAAVAQFIEWLKELFVSDSKLLAMVKQAKFDDLDPEAEVPAIPYENAKKILAALENISVQLEKAYVRGEYTPPSKDEYDGDETLAKDYDGELKNPETKKVGELGWSSTNATEIVQHFVILLNKAEVKRGMQFVKQYFDKVTNERPEYTNDAVDKILTKFAVVRNVRSMIVRYTRYSRALGVTLLRLSKTTKAPAEPAK